MLWFLLFAGPFCLLLVIGLFTGRPVKFAVWSVIVLAGIAFLVFGGMVIYVLNEKPHSSIIPTYSKPVINNQDTTSSYVGISTNNNELNCAQQATKFNTLYNTTPPYQSFYNLSSEKCFVYSIRTNDNFTVFNASQDLIQDDEIVDSCILDTSGNPVCNDVTPSNSLAGNITLAQALALRQQFIGQ